MATINRRKFMQKSGLLAAGLGLSMPAYSYNNIVGANRRVNVAVFGLNGRGGSLTNTFANTTDCRVAGLCDVDYRTIDKSTQGLVDQGFKKPKGHGDFRTFLDKKSIDAVVIATPDHWHTPMSLLAMDAGKHVYVEKPCSHNPAEGEMLLKKQGATGQLVQMGNQHRSAHTAIKVIKEIHEGLIGRAYYGKAWYANARPGIGTGKPAPVPEWLDYELWQGPAPRRAYQDNLVHYNWHWFKEYGTGEILNNGTHEIDLCRWALQVEFPESVNSSGGRFHYDDDWEFYDTQTTSYNFPGEKMINWEGRSCNGTGFWGRGRGAFIYGTEGSVLIDRGGIEVYDLAGKLIREEREEGDSVSMGLAGGGSMDSRHAHNFVTAINSGALLASPIHDANTSVTICHLGNIAQASGGIIRTDTANGMPLDSEAAKLWSREYAEGWAPKV